MGWGSCRLRALGETHRAPFEPLKSPNLDDRSSPCNRQLFSEGAFAFSAVLGSQESIQPKPVTAQSLPVFRAYRVLGSGVFRRFGAQTRTLQARHDQGLRLSALTLEQSRRGMWVRETAEVKPSLNQAGLTTTPTPLRNNLMGRHQARTPKSPAPQRYLVGDFSKESDLFLGWSSALGCSYSM